MFYHDGVSHSNKSYVTTKSSQTYWYNCYQHWYFLLWCILTKLHTFGLSPSRRSHYNKNSSEFLQKAAAVWLWKVFLYPCIHNALTWLWQRFWYFKTKTRMEPFCRRHLQLRYLGRKDFHLNLNFSEDCQKGLIDNYASIGSDNDLLPNKREAIKWNNEDTFYRRIYRLSARWQHFQGVSNGYTDCSLALSHRYVYIYTICIRSQLLNSMFLFFVVLWWRQLLQVGAVVKAINFLQSYLIFLRFAC